MGKPTYAMDMYGANQCYVKTGGIQAIDRLHRQALRVPVPRLCVIELENMPVNIYNEENYEKIDLLCKDIWDLPNQIDALEDWLRTKGKHITKGNYVADIGFDIRKDASGGGGTLDSESMKIMGEIGMNVYLSEYPGTIEK